MNVQFLNPFVEAAVEVLQAETKQKMTRGPLLLEKGPYKSDDITVVIGLVGHVEGTVFYSMSVSTAKALASRMLGEPVEAFDSLAQSGIAELGNVVTGRASVKLAEAGYESTISPPTVLEGFGTLISTLEFPRLVVPLEGECGKIVIHLALRENSNADASAAELPVPSAPTLK
jgi:chemotaxis protein CheX